jgi:hypothetical protein
VDLRRRFQEAVGPLCDGFAFRQRWLHWAHYRETDGIPMSTFPLPMAIATALALTLLAGTAHARGGGHGGGIAHPAPAASVVSAGQSTSMHQPKPMPPSKTPGGSMPPVTSSGVSSVSPVPPPAPTAAMPPSEIGTPMERVPDIAPLSPQLPTQFATGGTTQGTLALSPGSSSSSPSESAPSAPGGGGKTLAACMGFWDKATHMTKAEWKAACLRTMAEFPDVMR